MVENTLDRSKIEIGRMELGVVGFALPKAIDNAVTLVGEPAARRDEVVRVLLASFLEIAT